MDLIQIADELLMHIRMLKSALWPIIIYHTLFSYIIIVTGAKIKSACRPIAFDLRRIIFTLSVEWSN